MSTTVYLYVQDTLADWELGYTTAELNSGQYFARKGHRVPVVTVGASREPVVSKGGLTIAPEVTLDAVTPESSAMFMLIGADNWGEERHRPAIEKARELLAAGADVAAICGATAALANAGLLDDRPHTSNAPKYLELFAPEYKGQAHFRQERAVADGNLITASSAGTLQYARLILERLGVFSPAALDAWYRYYDTGDPQYYFALLGALPQ